jgi:hypothetical protein
MSNGFAAIMALNSIFFLFIGFTSSTPKPLMLAFWGTILLACVYKLFLKGNTVKR